MPLYTTLKYEAPIKAFEDLSPDTMRAMLHDVKTSLESFEPAWKAKSLNDVVNAIMSGEINLNNITRVNLKDAKRWLDAYTRYSEGGCKSCALRGAQTVDEDSHRFEWCKKLEGSADDAEKKAGYGMGWTRIIKKHYENPCEHWIPRFSPPLNVLVNDAAHPRTH